VNFFKSILLSLSVLTPFLAAIVLPVYPYPTEIKALREGAMRAKNHGEEIAESAALEKLVEYLPWEGEAWQRLGRLYLDLGRFDESVVAFDKAADLNELSIEGQVWYADALFRSGRENEARDYLRAFSLTAKVDPFIFLQAAVLQRGISDLSGALVTLLKALEVDPKNGEINYQTGLLLSVSEPDQSPPFLKNAQTFSPSRAVNSQTLIDLISKTTGQQNNSLRFVAIGQELATIHEWDVARLAFEKAVALDCANPEAWALLAEASQQTGEEGGDSINQALQLDPDSELVNGLSGLYYRRQGNYEMALEYLLKAAQLNPATFVWKLEIANTYAATGNLSSALESFKMPLKSRP
jgi:tetratricopeptide (TPR) repeat protein